MNNRAHAASTNCYRHGVLFVDIKASFPSFGTGRLFNETKSKPMDGDLIQQMDSVLCKCMIEM